MITGKGRGMTGGVTTSGVDVAEDVAISFDFVSTTGVDVDVVVACDGKVSSNIFVFDALDFGKNIGT